MTNINFDAIDQAFKPRKVWKHREIVTDQDHMEFQKECSELFDEFLLLHNTPSFLLRGNPNAKRMRFHRNMAVGKAKKAVEKHNGEIKKMICAALGEIKGDLDGLIPTLIGIFAGTALLGTVLTPAILAAIAIMIMKSGIAAFCAV